MVTASLIVYIQHQKIKFPINRKDYTVKAQRQYLSELFNVNKPENITEYKILLRKFR